MNKENKEVNEESITTVPVVPGYYDSRVPDLADQVPMEDLYKMYSGVVDNDLTDVDLRQVSITEYMVRTGWGDISRQAGMSDRARRKRQRSLRRAQQIQTHGKHLHIFTTWELVRAGIWITLGCLVASAGLAGLWWKLFGGLI